MLGAVLLRDPDLGEVDQCLLVEDRAGAGGQVDPEHSAVLGFDLALLADRGDDGGGVDDGSAVAAEHDLADCAVLLGWALDDLLEHVPAAAEAFGNELPLCLFGGADWPQRRSRSLSRGRCRARGQRIRDSGRA